MPTTNDISMISPALGDRIATARDTWTSVAQRRAAYHRDLTQMGRLSANELADLGISAADMRR